MLVVVVSPRPVAAFHLGRVAHGQDLLEVLDDVLLDFLTLVARPDVFVLQTEAILLVDLGNLLRHLTFLDCRQIRELEVFISDTLGQKLHVPDIIFAGLAGRETQTFHFIIDQDGSGIDILPENRIDRGEQLDRLNGFLRHPGFVQVEVEFLIIIFPPGIFRVDQYFLDTAVGEEFLLQLFRPGIQFVVVVAIHFDAV